MTEKEFLNSLKEALFPREVYINLGLDDAYVDERIEAYCPKPKKNQTQNIYGFSNDPLILLVNNYDLSKTEIGMISFDSEVTENEDYFYVGKVEVDYLCISKISHEVVVLPFEDQLSVAYRCSQNSFLFLESLVVAAKFLSKCSVDEDTYNNQNQICYIAEICSDLAGGRTYLDLYKVLIGCDL